MCLISDHQSKHKWVQTDSFNKRNFNSPNPKRQQSKTIKACYRIEHTIYNIHRTQSTFITTVLNCEQHIRPEFFNWVLREIARSFPKRS